LLPCVPTTDEGTAILAGGVGGIPKLSDPPLPEQPTSEMPKAIDTVTKIVFIVRSPRGARYSESSEPYRKLNFSLDSNDFDQLFTV
jgi:hypothetical protein